MKAVILAGGKNSRFWPLGHDRHKSMYEVGAGKPVIFYTLQEAKKAGLEKPIIVSRYTDLSIRNHPAINQAEVHFAIQAQPLGMGNALLSAGNFLKDNGYFFVMDPNHINSADVIEGIKKLLHEKRNAKAILVGQKTVTPWRFGVIEADGNRVLSVEEKPASPKSNIRVVGIYCFGRYFLEYLKRFDGEYGLESAINHFAQETNEVYFSLIPENRILPSLKYPWELLWINRLLMDRDFKKPAYDCQAAGVDIQGHVIMGNNVRFLGRASIKGPCYIGNDVVVGDYAVIRDHSLIGDGCVIGCKTEVKNSLLGHNVHTHDNFIGDSVIADGCRLGAGTIIANRRNDRANIRSLVEGAKIDTGLISFGTIMGQESKAGINVSIMPGIKIGKRSMIGPQTLVGEDVKDDCLYYSTSAIIKKIIR
ncbi:MAG: NTP transferase domain-containing protein [Candidatus Yanofskybacteria bacterium]|nr:NTP transferase domain-containing protein [Candidatus Yanofskybacteria bacterium]